MASGRGGRLLSFIRRYWLLVLWLIVNYAIFWTNYTKFKKKPQHVYLRNMIGRGLCISKATAAMLNVSCCLVLLPVCRTLNCILHHVLNRISRPALTFWLERAKVIHMTCAGTIIVASVVHTVAHVINAVNFSKYYDHEHQELNWARYESQDPMEMIFTSVAGLTGVAMVLLLVIVGATSLQCVRHAHYKLFWTTHQLFLPFLVLLLCHPLSGILKELDNPDTHAPGCHKPSSNMTSNLTHNRNSQLFENESIICATEAVFVPMKSQGWLWVAPSLALYGLDQVYRTVRRNQEHLYAIQALRLPGAAVQLKLQSPSRNFSCRPGQYILLQCPVISAIEWHPFTVISCSASSQPSFTILIRARGDWTEDLLGRVLIPFSENHHTVELCRWPSLKPVRFLMDGPFPSPMERVLHCRIAIYIAAGVGITPFIAAMDNLLNSSELPVKPERLHLVWLLRDAQQLQWFASVLSAVHKKFWLANQPDRLEIRIHMTKGYNLAKIQRALKDEHGVLRQRLWRGRPNWSESFCQWKDMYARQKVFVFTCGPKSLTQEIRKYCMESNQDGAVFQYTHEAFS